MARVIAIDDERDMLEMLDHVLAKQHAVTTFFDPRMARQALGGGRDLPQVILLDVMMPGLDGYTFMSALLDDERTRSIPVVVVTAKRNMADVFRSLPNLSGYLEKPFNTDALKTLVARAAAGGA